jgi:hypothetical protein
MANHYRRALPAMAACRVGDAVRVQACGCFRSAHIVRATAVNAAIVSRGTHRSALQCRAALDPAQLLEPVGDALRRLTPDVQLRCGATLPSAIGGPLRFIGIIWPA